MRELLHNVPAGGAVLDLGCGAGSFPSPGYSFVIFRTDIKRPDSPPPNFVQADAAKLPFKSKCFDLIISNHSLEHIADLNRALEEIGRVIKPTGALYAGAPDASTLSDRLYRWLGRGGGHVNRFTSAQQLAERIERTTQLKHQATRALCASFAYLNRKNHRARAPRKLLLVGGGTETSLLLGTWVFRLLDRWLGTRFTSYGWALYFGDTPAMDKSCWTNVCIRCGSGHASDWLLRRLRIVRRSLIFLRTYRCPHCGARNIFTEDRRVPVQDRAERGSGRSSPIL